MENKDKISKFKINKLVVVLAVIFLAGAAGFGGLYAWKTMKNNSETSSDVSHQNSNAEGEAKLDESGMPDDGSDITDVRKAKNEKTFRELLLAEGRFAIELTKDIRIDRGFLVNGTKKLIGDKSITMELYAEPFQSILKVQQGATLILDGLTLDGNSNATAIEVDKNAGFTSLSGTILYPLPHGVLNHGTTRIKDIKIERGVDSGLCVTGGGKAYVQGGEISGCSKAAVHVVLDGYVKISGDTKLTDSYMCINNRGVCEITGGVITDAWRTLVWNLAELTINYEGKTEDDKLEWYNAGEYGIRSGENSKTFINGVYIHDVEKGAIKGIKHESLTVTNCKVENAGTYGVESANGKKDVLFSDIDIKNTKNSAVRVYGTNKVEVTNVTVTDTEGRGIQNGNCTVIAKNIKITNSKLSGIYGGKGSTTEVDNAEIQSPQRYGVENYGGKITIKNTKITDAKLSGVIARKETVTDLKNVIIKNPTNRGVMNLGGTVTADAITIDSPGQYGVTTTLSGGHAGKLTVSNLTVKNVRTNNALNCHASTLVAEKVNVLDVEGYGAKVTGGGTMTIRDIKIKNCGMRGIAASNEKTVLNVTGAEVDHTGMSGVIVGSGATANLDNIVLKNLGMTSGTDTKYTASYRSALATTDGTINAKNVTVNDAVGNGVYVNGGTLNADTVTINCAGENGAFFTSSSTNGEAIVKINALTIDSPKNRGIYNDGGTAELSNVKIVNPTTYGVTTALLKNTEYRGSLQVKGLSITGVKEENALNCNASVMTVVDATISDVKGHGARVRGGGELTLKDVKLSDCGTRGLSIEDNGTKATIRNTEISNIPNSAIYNMGAIATLENVRIKEAQYGLFVDGGVISEGSKTVAIADVSESGFYIKSTKEYGQAKANIEDLTVTNAKKRGVYNVGAEVTLAGATITNPGEYGITTGKTSWTIEDATTTCTGKVTASNVSITGVQKNNALHCNASEMMVVGGTISDVAEYGARVVSGGKLTMRQVQMKDCGIHGVYLTGEKSQATIEDTSIANVVERGIWSEKAKTTLNNVEVNDALYGVFVDGGTTTFNGGKVAKASAQGIYITSANQGEAVADIKGVTICEAAKRGVYNVGGKVTLSDVTITDPGEYGISSGTASVETKEGKTTYKGKVTATNLTVTGVKKNNALHCNASEIEVTNGQITDIKEYAARVVSNGKITLNQVNIAQSQKSALNVQRGSLTMTGGTITGTVGYDVDLNEPNGKAEITLTDVTITRAKDNTHGSMTVARGKDKDGKDYEGTTTLTLNNCNLIGNSETVTAESAITVTKGTLNIQNGGRYENYVSTESGGVIYIAPTGVVNMNQGETKALVTFKNNGCNSTASYVGGGVINVQNGGVLKADTCAFIENTVKCTGTSVCGGGAISVSSKTDGNVVIKNATFDGNQINSKNAYGGAISVGGGCYLTMENCVFGQEKPNVAATGGNDVRGADKTKFNISGKIVAEFYNTSNPHTLHLTGNLSSDSRIVMKWKNIKGIVEDKDSVITFADANLISTNKTYFNLHEDHDANYKLAYSTTYKKGVVKEK